MAQRLVRKICPQSGIKEPVAGSIQMMLERQFATLPDEFKARVPKADSIMRIQASPECPNGTRGRTAVIETLEISPEIEKLILEDGSEADMYEVARRKGFVSMYEDALIKALRHEIPFEEVNGLGGSGGHMITIEEDLEVSSAPPVDNSGVTPTDGRV
jgi:type IV pilus assembly protein PilB